MRHVDKGFLHTVPGSAVPRPCRMCGVEIVRTATAVGLIHIEYASIREQSNGAGKAPKYAGHEHRCPVVEKVNETRASK